MLFTSKRIFQIWDYNVSHRQLLLRSPKSPTESNNVDIICWGVHYMELPCVLSGVEISRAVPNQVAHVQERLKVNIDIDNIFGIASTSRSFVIVVAGFKIVQNDLEIFDSSLTYFNKPDRKDVGEVLFQIG